MSKKLTLKEKQLVSEHVTNETKRCMALIKNYIDNITNNESLSCDGVIKDELKDIYAMMIEGTPHIEFYPELLKRIPK